MGKIILDLCGGTGAWSNPYKKAGYDVWVITLPDYDVTEAKVSQGILTFSNRTTMKTMSIDAEEVYGILAAPPCTQFSWARTNAKKKRNLKEGMRIVEACLRIIRECQYSLKEDYQKKTSLKFWALENPYYGFLKQFLGNPVFVFDPFEFGDGYKKRTSLWGYFKEPVKRPVELSEEMIRLCKTNSRPLPKFDALKTKEIHPEFYGKLTRRERRAITPTGFAKAFFEANK